MHVRVDRLRDVERVCEVVIPIRNQRIYSSEISFFGLFMLA
jgi:hypothetical protein